jgi:hypothetical protein
MLPNLGMTKISELMFEDMNKNYWVVQVKQRHYLPNLGKTKISELMFEDTNKNYWVVQVKQKL